MVPDYLLKIINTQAIHSILLGLLVFGFVLMLVYSVVMIDAVKKLQEKVERFR